MKRKLHRAKAGGISTKYRSCDGLFLKIDQFTQEFGLAVGREWRALQLFHSPTLCKGNTLPDLCKGMHCGHRALYLSVFFPTETNGVNCAED